MTPRLGHGPTITESAIDYNRADYGYSEFPLDSQRDQKHAGARLVVFTGQLAHSVVKGIVEIDRAMPGTEWLILLEQRLRTPSRLLRSQWINLKRHGWRWIPYQASDLGRRLSGERPPPPDAPGRLYEASSLERLTHARVLRVQSLHAEASRRAVESFAPDLGLSLAAPILRPPLFTLPRLGTINLHKGRVPEYRGMPPAFWELWNDESSVGCTVHRVTAALDAGEVIRSGSIRRARYSTVRGLQIALDELGIELMTEAVRDLLAGEARPVPQSPGGRTYRKPTLAQEAALRAKLDRRRPRSAPPAAQAVKDLRAILGRNLWQHGLRPTLPPRITVLLYHRVSDDARDNLTVGVEQFERQMSLLSRHCDVMSLDQVLAAERIEPSSRPRVAVTFDDGYRDNYDFAVPILLRHRVPAAFFVSTGIVNTDRRFPHDIRRNNPYVPVMSWDHLRRMRDWGFTLGSHTVFHIDCAAEPANVVREELERSYDDLRRELGLERAVFAYPYGGRENMTPDRLQLVRAAGYRACLAAYGGSNVERVDPFEVRRKGIHWEFSDPGFLYAALGIS